MPYQRILAGAAAAGGDGPGPDLIAALEDAWLRAYFAASSHDANVLKFEDGGFTFLFDHASARGSEVEDRLVVGYGLSTRPSRSRDASRMRRFLGGRIEIRGKGVFDKGHVMAHAAGGGLDVNLFPQHPEVNRGRSPRGKVYRRMERYAATHPGTFVFSRLWYDDASWVPAWLEYGVLRQDCGLWVERFPNLPEPTARKRR